SLRIAPQHTVPYHITAAVVPAMDADTAASRRQETTYESDSVLEDIGLLFKDSMDKPTIRCWNEAEICEIIHDNHETVQLMSRGGAYTATFNRRLLIRLSPYFRALLEGGFKESVMDVLSLDASVNQMRMFEQWVCTGDFDVPKAQPSQTMRIYMFADYHDIPALRRTIMSKLVMKKGKPWAFAWAGLAVELPSSSPMYKFLVETYVQHTEHPTNGNYEMLTKEFLYKMFLGVATKSGDKPCKCCHNPCDFHDHDSEKEWEKTCHLIHPEFPKPDPSTYRKRLYATKIRTPASNISITMDQSDTAHQTIAQISASTVSTDESSSSAVWLPVEAPSSSATMLCWNKETVSRIISDFPQTVKVRVSHHLLRDECIVDINKALLICFSPYYRAVFLGGFSDQDQAIFVMEISLEDMHAFKRWLYDGELELDLESHDDAYRQLIRLYVFADYYDFPALRRAIMSLLLQGPGRSITSFCLVPRFFPQQPSPRTILPFSSFTDTATSPLLTSPSLLPNMEEAMTEKAESVSSSDQIQKSQTSELQATFEAHLKMQEKLEAQLSATRQETRVLQETYDKHIKFINGSVDSLLEAEVERLIQEKGLPLPQEPGSLVTHAIGEWVRYKNLSDERERKIESLLTRICTADAVLEFHERANYADQIWKHYERMHESDERNTTRFCEAIEKNAALVQELKDSDHAKHLEIIRLNIRHTYQEANISRLENDKTKLEKELELEKEENKEENRSLQEETSQLIKRQTELVKKRFAFLEALSEAVGLSYRDEMSITKRIAEIQDDLATQNLALESVIGDSDTAKIELLKAARNQRDGIYNTLDVSSCLGAHLAIGNLKLAQLDSGILRKAIGDFEDDAAVAEIKRLKRADLELVKVVSALDGVAGDSNVAKIDKLK
ncbi:hypothetical protein KCU89_g7190, partial [Aureobasidium melanogenum]